MKVGNLTLLKLIGKGTMGEVYLSSKKDSKEYYATKKINKEYADRPQVKKYFLNEISILKKLKHNKIVRLIDLKQTPSHYYIVMEYCNGGSLLSCLKKYMSKYKKPFSEEIVQFLMRQIVKGLKYIHEHGIIHRDIKLDNILVKFYSQDDLSNYNMMKTHVKISDFGISAKLGENKLAFTALGSPAYMDPFILKKLNERNDLLNSEGYDQSADIWSLGAMCYEMLMGKRVFTGRNIKDLYKKVEIGNYTLPTHLSKEVVSFINGMLQYDSSKRLTIEELSRHHFLTRKTKDFNTIDFVLVAEKLGTKGIYINTKKNETMWNIFNEETEVKLNNIPTRILDKNTFPDNLPGESEFESKNDVQILPKTFENITQNEQYPNYNDNFNKININQLTQNEFNFKNKKDNVIKKEDKKIQNTDNFGGNNKNISNSHIQFNPKNMKDFNNQNFTTDFNNINNINITNNATFIPYNVGRNDFNQNNINITNNATFIPYNAVKSDFNQNNNPQFFGAQTIKPHLNDNQNINNINSDKQNDPNYPGDIKVKKQIATTDESCMHQ